MFWTVPQQSPTSGNFSHQLFIYFFIIRTSSEWPFCPPDEHSVCLIQQQISIPRGLSQACSALHLDHATYLRMFPILITRVLVKILDDQAQPWFPHLLLSSSTFTRNRTSFYLPSTTTTTSLERWFLTAWISKEHSPFMSIDRQATHVFILTGSGV